MATVLALVSALSYGVSDVIGGLAARRISFIRVALLGQTGGLCATALIMAVLVPPTVQGSDLAWGAASGVGTGLGMVFLFRGMGRGAMSIVVPLSAVGGVALPVIVAVAFLGERPSWLTWAGIVMAVPALWVITRSTDDRDTATRASVVNGLAAGGGIALQYLCLAQASGSSGLWPIFSGRATALATILVVAALFVRRAEPGGRPSAFRSVLAMSVGSGVLAAAALTAYLYALTSELVTVTVVLSSLYPIVPIVVGLVVLHERLRRGQVVGLSLALAATVLIAVA